VLSSSALFLIFRLKVSLDDNLNLLTEINEHLWTTLLETYNHEVLFNTFESTLLKCLRGEDCMKTIM
jgi:hypothetical protein